MMREIGIGARIVVGMAIAPLDSGSTQPSLFRGVRGTSSQFWNSNRHCIEPESTYFLWWLNDA